MTAPTTAGLVEALERIANTPAHNYIAQGPRLPASIAREALRAYQAQSAVPQRETTVSNLLEAKRAWPKEQNAALILDPDFRVPVRLGDLQALEEMT